MTVDHYAGAGRRWADGASLVYGPIARELVAMARHALAGRLVLDAGAGTGVASSSLAEHGASTVAVDLSIDMLEQDAVDRPPAAVANIEELPLRDRSVDDTVASFVLNHLIEPRHGFDELVRVTRPGGALLACVYANASKSEVRDAVDESALAAGWRVPDWYVAMKTAIAPALGTAPDMLRAATRAGLVGVVVEERAVDVGVTEPEQLVDYRFGQAHFASWLDEIGPARSEVVRHDAVEAIRPIMRPYRPIVVFLSCVVPD